MGTVPLPGPWCLEQVVPLGKSTGNCTVHAIFWGDFCSNRPLSEVHSVLQITPYPVSDANFASLLAACEEERAGCCPWQMFPLHLSGCRVGTAQRGNCWDWTPRQTLLGKPPLLVTSLGTRQGNATTQQDQEQSPLSWWDVPHHL